MHKPVRYAQSNMHKRVEYAQQIRTSLFEYAQEVVGSMGEPHYIPVTMLTFESFYRIVKHVADQHNQRASKKVIKKIYEEWSNAPRVVGSISIFAEKYNVSKRTIAYVLTSMKLAGVLIETKRGNSGSTIIHNSIAVNELLQQFEPALYKEVKDNNIAITTTPPSEELTRCIKDSVVVVSHGNKQYPIFKKDQKPRILALLSILLYKAKPVTKEVLNDEGFLNALMESFVRGKTAEFVAFLLQPPAYTKSPVGAVISCVFKDKELNYDKTALYKLNSMMIELEKFFADVKNHANWKSAVSILLERFYDDSNPMGFWDMASAAMDIYKNVTAFCSKLETRVPGAAIRNYLLGTLDISQNEVSAQR